MSQEKLAIIMICAVVLAMIWLASYVLHIISWKRLMKWYGLASLLTVFTTSILVAIILGSRIWSLVVIR